MNPWEEVLRCTDARREPTTLSVQVGGLLATRPGFHSARPYWVKESDFEEPLHAGALPKKGRGGGAEGRGKDERRREIVWDAEHFMNGVEGVLPFDNNAEYCVRCTLSWPFAIRYKGYSDTRIDSEELQQIHVIESSTIFEFRCCEISHK